MVKKRLHAKAPKMSVYLFQMTKRIFIVKRDKEVHLTMSTFPAKSAVTRGVTVFRVGMRIQGLGCYSASTPRLSRCGAVGDGASSPRET